MNAFLQFLSGKKTYLTIAVLFVVLFGVWQAWWKVPDQVYVLLFAMAITFLRSAIGGPPTPPPAPAADPQPAIKPPSGPTAAALLLFTSSGAWLRPLAHVSALLAVLVILPGCASIEPGADPIVVQTERAEILGKSSFELILHVDNSNRPYFATNAPAFHDFCQWLRQPQLIEGTNLQPRAVALILSLDDVKLDYKAGRTSSNALWVACTTFEGLVSQAQAWSNVIFSKTIP